MQNYKFIFLFLFLIYFFSFVSADCFPNYVCGEWSICDDDGLSTQICSDTKCGADDIISRRICGESDCEPSIHCGEWSTCNFFDKTNDILTKELIFEGARERICADSAKCVDSFVESESCSLSVPINVKKAEWCGEELVEIFDDDGNIVGRIKSTEVVKNYNRVDISLVDSTISTYCSYCYDGELDFDEEDVDCGGPSCPRCVEVIDFIDWAYIVSILSWGIFILLFFIGLILLGKNESFSDGLKSLLYFFKPLSREEALAREQRIKEFIAPKKISSEGFKNY